MSRIEKISEEIREALHWRYATKVMEMGRKIPLNDWKLLEESLVLSPSSYGLQPWKFLVIENPELRAKLRAVSWGQSQVTDASHFVVFTAKEKLDEAYIEKHIARTAQVREIPQSSMDAYKNLIAQNLIQGPRSQSLGAWAQRQAYIAMGFLLETAALLKIDATPMEGLEPEKYDQILGLEGSGPGLSL